MAFVRRSLSAWPEMRRTTGAWWRWIVRQLLLPVWPLACTITTRRDTRYRLDRDPVDDILLRSLCTKDRALYFPDLRGFDPDGPILDIGAHHGFYGIEALARYPRSTLIAVEPDAESCQALARNLALNGFERRARIVCAGLGAASGEARLERDPSGSWGTRAVAVKSAPAGEATGPATRLLTLDEILAGERPVVIKCNAEGAEFSLVPQLVRSELRPALVVLMAHPSFGRPAALVRQLEAAGYLVTDADTPPRGARFHARWPGASEADRH